MDEEFSVFVAARSPHLYRSAYLLTTSAQSAEDLVQSALTKAYAAWWRVRKADDPVAYVHGIVIKTFLSDRRKRSSTELPVADTPDVVRHEDPAQRVALIEALRTLGDIDRGVVVLRFWEDLSVADTAAALGLSPAAVKNRSLRALRALRHELGEPPGEPTDEARMTDHTPWRRR
ncbi:MAG: SigE family RNA polymerase sigma factor [Nocardioides sp.]|nr:SigE family RNA polymerase sigma factor [Nocardioides sp.]